MSEPGLGSGRGSEPWRCVRSPAVLLPMDDIDTDQIIPARFLKGTGRGDLSTALFGERRKDPSFPLNQPGAKGAEILVAGKRFGIGSSREHAVWALRSWGFRAILAPSFGEIFANNAYQNGLLPVSLAAGDHGLLSEACRSDPTLEVSVDLERCEVALPKGRAFAFEVNDFARHCLLNGIDELDYLLSLDAEISRFEEGRKA